MLIFKMTLEVFQEVILMLIKCQWEKKSLIVNFKILLYSLLVDEPVSGLEDYDVLDVITKGLDNDH